ncbi:MAG TPA: metallopeptidase family protein [Mycobacteriales bacterium]|nr:metallopeptidase family protein [Mycobacteriales bacterium]
MTPPRRRERRGRGRRGGLLPEGVQVGTRVVRVPAWRTRAEQFTAIVHDEVRALHRRWGEQLGDLRVLVEDVPPPLDEPGDGVLDDGSAAGDVALARAEPGLVVVYRRPLELRAESPEDLAELVHEVIVEAVADLLGLDPDELDPGQG